MLWTLSAAGVLLLLLGIAIPAEMSARGRLDSVLAKLEDRTPGVAAASAGGPALWQIALGRVDLTLTLDDEVLERLVSCRMDGDPTVATTAAGVVVEIERTVRGVTLPVSLLLVPQRAGGEWVLAADSVSVGGLSIPATQAAAILGGRGADAAALLDGVSLPVGSAASVTNLAASRGQLHVGLSIPMTQGAADGGRILGSCLDEGAPQ